MSNAGTIVYTGTNISPTLTLTGTNTSLNVLDAIIANNGTGVTTVAKTGAGEWELNAVNTFTGNMNLSAGTLVLGKATAVQDAVLNYTGGTVNLFAGANNMAGLAGTAGNNITIGTNSLNVTTTTGVTSTFSGNIVSGAGSVVIAGAGTEAFNGTSSNYTGSTTISGGTLSVNTLALGGVVSSIGNSTNAAANLIINGGTLQYTGAGATTDRLFTIGVNGATLDASGTGALTMSNAGTIVYTGTNISPTLTLTGTNTSLNVLDAIIANNGTGVTTVAKTGAGEWELNAANTFTGNMNLSVGTLVLGTATAVQDAVLNYTGGTVNLFAGANNMAGLAGTAGNNITIGTDSLNITTASGVTSTFIGNIVSGAGSVVIAGAGTEALSGTSSNFTGNVNLTAGTLTLGTATAVQDAVLNYTGGTVNLFAGANNIAGLAGTAGNNITIGTDSLNITTTTGVTSTFSGNIVSGAGSVVIAGAGTEAFNGTSSNYTGTTTINGGTLSVSTLALGGANSGIGKSTNAAANLILNGGTLQYLGASAQTTDRLFTIGPNGATLDSSNATAANTITFSNGSALAFSSSTAPATLTLTGLNTGANTLDSIIGDAGTGTNVTTVNKTGAGNWTLAAANTFTGNTNIQLGTLNISTNLALQDSTVDITGGAFTFGALNNATIGGLAGTVNVALPSSFALTINTAAATNDIYSGALSGTSASLTKNGTGAETLTGINTYTGGTTINAGTLSFNGANTFASGTVTLAGGTLDFNNASALGSATFTITGGNLDATNGAITNSNSNAQNWNGDFTFIGTNSLNLGTGAVTLGSNRIVTVSANTLTVGGIISGTGLNLTLNGAGTLALGGVNTFSGNMNLTNNNGTLTLTNLNALQNATLNYTSNTTLNLATGTNVFGGLAGSSNIALGTNNLTLNTNTGLTDTYSGNLSGTGNLTKNGTGTETFSGLNTYTGVTTLNGGTLSVSSLALGGAASGIGQSTNAASNLIFNGGALQYTGAGATTDRLFTIGSNGATIDASGTGVLTLSNAGSIVYTGTNISPTLTLTGTNTGANTLDAILANNGTGATALIKSGAGEWVLGGLNTYTGVTTINGGTLSVSTLALGGSASGIGSSTNAAANLVINGGALQYTGSGATTDRLFTIGSAGATIDASGTGALNLSNAGSIVYTGTNISPTLTLTGSNTGANTLAAILANNGTGATSLVKNGAGDWLLTGASTYTGGTTINNGLLEVSGNNALGGAGGPVTVASGATLRLDNNFDITGTGATAGSSNGSLLTLSGTGVGGIGALVNGNGTASTAEWQGNIALGADTTISSGTTSGGCLTLGNNGSSFTSNLSLGASNLTFIGGPGTTTQVNANITGTGNVTVNTDATSTVMYEMDGNGYTGTTFVNNGTLILDTTSSSVGLLPGSGNLLAINGPLVVGDAVGAANTAVVQLGTTAGDLARNVIAMNSSVTINPDGFFNVNGQDQIIGSLTMNAGLIDTTNHVTSSFGTLTLAGNATIQANAVTAVINGNFEMANSVGNQTTVFTVTAGGNTTSDLTINALLSGGAMVKNGNGTMTLTNNSNSYTGTTEVQAGTLNIQASGALGANGNNAPAEGTTVDATAQLQLQGNISIGNEYLTLNGNGTAGSDGALRNVAGNNSWAGTVVVNTNSDVNTTTGSSLYFSGNVGANGSASTLTFNGNGNTTLSGNINGALSVVKNGTGTLLYNGTTGSTNTGSTTINAGTLELNKTSGVVAVSGSSITINSGGTLLSDTTENIGNGVNMVLNGGTWTTNGASAASWTENLNTLTLSAISTLNLGANNNTVAYTNSSGTTWAGGAFLYIDGWNGLLAGGGNDEVFFGSSAGGLGGTSTTGQLGEVIFVNPTINGVAESSEYHAIILSTGEVVPFLATPEPGTVAAGAALGALALLRELRRRKNRAAIGTK